MDFGKRVRVDKIIYSPRNWDNYIKPGCDYELFYCDGIWKSAGTLRAEADSLVFPDVPEGVLYISRLYHISVIFPCSCPAGICNGGF